MRLIYFIYGITCYLIFFLTFLYAIGFVGNFVVPKSMDTGPEVPIGIALVINMLLLGVFAVQHSVMARRDFKKFWTKIIPTEIERNTYVLLSSLALALIFWQWRPMGGVIWDVSGTALGSVLIGISLIGWTFVLISTFLLNHFELLGLSQAYSNLTGKTFESSKFRTPGFYKFVRHPIYFGFTVAFWATPVMSTAHLVFAIGTLGYTLVGIYLEEKDLIFVYGEEYKKYKSKVSMLIPLPNRR
ncbi:NnrU family protein [Reinekea marina]|uniref:methanethiol S-methyltransferase n=1 Tax=Reinekea marina TaxID=1310421 RepID=A0ABV7WQ04_9GAMM|nr:methanethiol S-methyltransferase [Reinekea marina]MDN3650406.1 NnrU family protein [Reinekea marina]